MAWIEWNPNPHGRRGNDCTVRAISKALGISWDEAYLRIVLEGFIQKDMPSTNSIWGSALYRMGFEVYSLPGPCPDCVSVREFAASCPHGTFIAATGSHVVAIVDGDWEDVANMVKTVKNIDLIMEHEEGSRSGGASQRGYSMGSYDHDDSSYRRGRDSMGRYTSREGASEGMRRSYDDEMKSMKDELRAMMEKLDTMR